MADDNKSPSPEAGPSGTADNQNPGSQEELAQEPRGEFARGNSTWAQIERNPIRYFQFLERDVHVAMALYNIRNEARNLRDNSEPNEFEHFERLLQDWVAALRVREPNSRYTELTPAHLDNVNEFLRRPGLRFMSPMYIYLNPDWSLPAATVFARGGDVDSAVMEPGSDVRDVYHSLIRLAEEIVGPWRRSEALPQQDGGGEFGWTGLDSREIIPDETQVIWHIEQTMRPGSTDNPNIRLFSDNEDSGFFFNYRRYR